MGTDREWSVSDLPAERLAELGQWLAAQLAEQGRGAWVVSADPIAQTEARQAWLTLRAEERARATARTTRDDAMAGPDTYSMTDDPDVNGQATTRRIPTIRKTVDPIADRATLTRPISGVHVTPTFGRGEYVAPFLGGSDSVTEYATPEEADAWLYVADHTMGDVFAARVLSVMRSEADEHGRRVDWSKSDDVESDARMRFVAMVTDLLTRDDVVRVDGYPMGRIDPGEGARDVVSGTGEFLVPRLARCGGCEGCKLARERQSAGRASRWNVKGCEAPVNVIDAVSPSRLLTRAIWRAAADPTLATGAVYATRSKYFRSNLAADVLIDHDVNLNGGDDPLRYVPTDAGNLIRFMASALDAIDSADNVTMAKGLSPVARAILTRVMGTADTRMGEETALKRARVLWPAEHGTRRDARERERAERETARAERRNAGKRARRAETDPAVAAEMAHLARRAGSATQGA